MARLSTPDAVKDDLRRHYDAMAAGVALHAGDDIPALPRLERLPAAARFFYERKLAVALALSHLRPPARILDVGCGYGIFTYALAGMGFTVAGVDLSPRYVGLAREAGKGRTHGAERFHVADAEDLSEFPDASFDAVVSFSTLRYVPRPSRALAEFRRVIRPGGVVVVDFPNRFSPWFRMIKPWTGTRPHMHDHLTTPREAVHLLAGAGFTDIRHQVLLFSPKTAPSWLFPVLRTAGTILEAMPLARRCGAIVMTCGRA
jgi:ubiquinone/menaquinone biosynthesis C-methylase UbiE